MAFKISHSNKKNTSFTLQVLLDPKGKSVDNIELHPNQHFFCEVEFKTPSLRIMESKQFIKIETVKSTPKGAKYYKLYDNGLGYGGTTAPKTEESPEKASENKSQTKKEDAPKESLLNKAAQQVSSYAKTEESQEDKESDDELDEDGLKTGRWDDSEETYIKRFYPTKGGPFVAEKLNRSVKSVSKKAESLNLKRKRKKHKKKK